MGDKLEFFVQCLPRIHELIGTNCDISVADKEKYIAYIHGTELNLPVDAGDAVKKGSISGTAMQEKRRVTKRIGKELFGVPYLGIGTPLFDEKGDIIGALGLALPITLQEKLNTLLNEMKNSLGILEKSTEDIAANSQEIAANVSDLARSIGDIMSKMDVVNTILGFLKDVSDKTHLLGLNASIEAARAGDNGRGFNIVAAEIRNLADKTKNSLKMINKEVADILDGIEQINFNSQRIAEASDIQANNNMEICQTTQRIRDDSLEIVECSQKLVS
ncbi:MAG: methyl-accepting chemotaxis protein [Bacillota bacterium]